MARQVTLDKRLKSRVLKRDKYLCGYCGSEATEVDHVVPLLPALSIKLPLLPPGSLCVTCDESVQNISHTSWRHLPVGRQGKNFRFSLDNRYSRCYAAVAHSHGVTSLGQGSGDNARPPPLSKESPMSKLTDDQRLALEKLDAEDAMHKDALIQELDLLQAHEDRIRVFRRRIHEHKQRIREINERLGVTE